MKKCHMLKNKECFTKTRNVCTKIPTQIRVFFRTYPENIILIYDPNFRVFKKFLTFRNIFQTFDF